MSGAVLVVGLYPVDFARCAALLYAIWRGFGDKIHPITIEFAGCETPVRPTLGRVWLLATW